MQIIQNINRFFLYDVQINDLKHVAQYDTIIKDKTERTA